MKRKIRLTESEFKALIKRMVIETKHQYDEEIIEDESGEEMTKVDAIQKIADYFKNEVLPELDQNEVEELQDKVQDAKSKVTENLYEEEDEDMNDLDSRKKSRREKMLMRGGLGTSAVAAVLSLGEFMGYSEFEITSMLHDLNHMAGLERYTGPVTVGMVFLGLAAALKGLDMRFKRTGK